jgi:hypothetical protein
MDSYFKGSKATGKYASSSATSAVRGSQSSAKKSTTKEDEVDKDEDWETVTRDKLSSDEEGVEESVGKHTNESVVSRWTTPRQKTAQSARSSKRPLEVSERFSVAKKSTDSTTRLIDAVEKLAASPKPMKTREENVIDKAITLRSWRRW